MSVELKAEITAKGTAYKLIDEVMSYADTLNTANVNQETFKSNRPTLTDEAVKTFNDYYIDVTSIAKIIRCF